MLGHELLVGRYELCGLLGCGGMAEVHDGWDQLLQRNVAVKVLHPALQAQPEVRRRFEREARAAASLCHSNIVAVHDYGEHDGTPFIIMERLPGPTLADLIEQGPMPTDLVWSMLNDVLGGLAAAHSAAVLHRDIKPANILMSAPGDTMKVADFGIAKTGDSARTQIGQIIGTLAYMSPESVSGATPSAGDDLYAVGVMGYEALLGHHLFPEDTPAALVRAITTGPVPPVAALRDDVHPMLAGVIDRAVARDPARRFPSAVQMRAALGGDPHALYAPPPRPHRKVRSRGSPATAGLFERLRALAGDGAAVRRHAT